MMEEQLIEVTNKINQIQRLLHRRKQRVSEINIHYKKILEDKPNKQFYMSRSFNSQSLYNEKQGDSQQTKKKFLQKKLMISRQKIRKHHNVLKQLDMLQKQRNRIRIVIQEQKQREKMKQKQRLLSQDNHTFLDRSKKQNNKAQNSKNANNLYRTMKQRSNPFCNAKVDKFVQLYHQNKYTQQNIAPKLMKYFGVGVQNTPLGINLRKKENRGDNKQNKGTNDSQPKVTKNNFAKSFNNIFHSNSKIFGNNRSPNLFENRIRKIIKYHGDFWNEEFQIK